MKHGVRPPPYDITQQPVSSVVSRFFGLEFGGVFVRSLRAVDPLVSVR